MLLGLESLKPSLTPVGPPLRVMRGLLRAVGTAGAVRSARAWRAGAVRVVTADGLDGLIAIHACDVTPELITLSSKLGTVTCEHLRSEGNLAAYRATEAQGRGAVGVDSVLVDAAGAEAAVDTLAETGVVRGLPIVEITLLRLRALLARRGPHRSSTCAPHASGIGRATLAQATCRTST